jgi:DnaJ family protein C protein 28
MGKWESLVDKLIRESMERGEFDNLPGAGQPIDLTENPFEDPELRTAHRLLRNAGFAPAWMEERKDIDAEFERARTTLLRASDLYEKNGALAGEPHWQRAVKEFRETVKELNRRVRIYNLKAPAAAFHRKTIDAESLIRQIEIESKTR